MNKQELIKKYEHMNHDCFRRVDVSEVLSDLIRLDKPQKPVIPQFVADWIEKHKKALSLRDAMNQVYRNVKVDKWLVELDEDGNFINQDLFARAWLDRYRIEEEVKYTVKMVKTEQYLYSRDNDFCFITYVRPDDNPHNCHTRKELEDAGFGEVFNSPLFEVEEVEE
ncbi:phage protein [Streptococcus gordonii]|uniref:DUF1642 domain-containing protein n=1 Tax=Streptococcus gordonii TaxID=1302 RepID=UPI000779BA4D|nr:DUF1642 domain-containing protein [Streptococcus gordonii]VTT11412.1 phage protein [Streptococcus gordonii]